MYHYRKTHKTYHQHRKRAPTSQCNFCNMREAVNEIVGETAHAWIIKNRVQYDMWDLRNTVDHLMVIPRRHVRTLQELNSEERLDIMNVIADYEANDYNVYARSAHSTVRSVAHQHTHLIKTQGRAARGMVYLLKPYLFIKF